MSVFTLAQLCTNLTDIRLPPGAGDQRIRHVRDDSRQVEPGDLFVAVRGTATDGAAYVHEAAARGAAAVVAEVPVDAADSTVPLVLVPDARIARAELGAAFYGHPAARLSMIGITGTVGKTTVLAMLSEILASARISAGTIGSLGIEYPGTAVTTRNTTPGPLAIHEALSSMAAAGVRVAAMEVTSHALVQERVYGLEYDLGVFTNLTMLEHLEYHRSFRAYATAKLRFLEHLKPDAPLIYSAGDRLLGQAARRHSGPRVSCGGGRGWVGVRRDALSLRGTRVTLTVRRPLPRLDGSCLEPCTVPLRLQT
ncbi:MAG: Mur ligase family protein, partial [Longimicrobiales bacterium]